MTKEILKRAIELDWAIKRTEDWMRELREADTVFRVQKDSGRFSLRIKTESGTERFFDIPANAALEAIKIAHSEILKENERMSSKFKELH